MATTKEKQLDTIATGKTAFSIEQNELLDALVLCAKVVPRSSSIPLLQCIKFDLKKDSLFVTAMDAPAQAVLQVLKVTNENGVDGSYCMNAKEVIELVKRMPGGNLSFTQQDSTVTVTYGERGRANLQVLSSEQYPELPKPAKSNFLSCPIEMLRKGAHAARFAGTDEKTPSISSVFLHNAGGKLGFTATDRHRIYRYISDIAIEEPESFQDAMIMAVQFKGIIDSLKSSKVDLAIAESHLVLRDKNIVYFGRLTDGNYPNIQFIFDRSQEGTAVTVSRAELDDTLNRMLSLSGVENNRVTLEVNENDEFTIHSQSQTGEICEGFPGAKVDEGFPTVKYNARYLRDALLVGDREVKNVSLRTAGIGQPGYIEFDGDSSVITVVNQVR
ncbi:DNA polymerase III subunit beta [Paenibacillus gansuensis]|uniref:DNA polymerase III subunit beta n=1 Tax=Paenibacillus gansuensis TaxID=306542 RepID=A0ABW5PJE4_9BACL